MGKRKQKSDEGGVGVMDAPDDSRRPDAGAVDGVQASAQDDPAPAAPLAADRYEPALQLDLLQASASNPRKHFDAADIAALAEDLKQHGQIQPILVRPVDVSGDVVNAYEIVVGERRYRAAKLAGLPALMATVRELSDVDVLKIQLAENAKRQDITPLEEAAAYQDLMKKAGWDAKQLAADQKVSVRQVYARLALLDLPDGVRKALEKGEITAAHAEIIGRLPDKKLQAAALEMAVVSRGWDEERVTATVPIRAFEEQIKRDLLRELTAAPWDLDDAKLCPKAGACSGCPKRSLASEPLLADQVKDCCMDAKCWDEKAQAHLVVAIKDLQAQGPLILLATDRHVPDSLKRAISGDLYSAALFREVKDSHKDAQRAVYVNGGSAGQVRYVVPNRKEIEERAGWDGEARELLKDIKADAPAGQGGKAEPAKKKTPVKERVAMLESRRSGNIVDHLREKVLPKFSTAEFITMHGELWLFHLNALACAFGVSNSLGDVYGGKGWTTFKKLCEKSGTKLPVYEPLAEKLWPAVRSQIVQALQYQTLADIKPDNVKACIELLGLKWEDLHASACHAIPTPKSLAEEIGEPEESAEKIPAKEIAKKVKAAKGKRKAKK